MEGKELVRRIATLVKEGKPFATAKVVAAAEGFPHAPGEGWIVHASGRVEGERLDAALAAFLAAEGRAVLSTRTARAVLFTAAAPGGGAGEEKPSRSPAAGGKPPGGKAAAGGTRIFFDPLALPETLVVAGAGHIAAPLADMAAQAGFRVIVIDDRPGFASPERFPRAWRTVTAPFGEALKGLDLGPSSFVVIVTRGHAHDRECLEAVIGTEAGYIGMIGSRRRAAAVLDALAAAGAPGERLDGVHTPIGLDIGAATPAEIAVSILAELIAHRRRGSSPLSLLHKRRRGGANAGKGRDGAPPAGS